MNEKSTTHGPKYICKFEIVPYFKDVLKEMLKKSSVHYLFGNSLNDVTQSCQMDVLIRYFEIL